MTDNLNAPSNFGETPIHKAASNGQTEIVTPSTDNPNAPNEFGGTPIHIAAQNGHTEIVTFLTNMT